jgi:5'-nucleotidase (lipoprotein e(P4) family)
MKKSILATAFVTTLTVGSLAGISIGKAEIAKSTQEHLVAATNWFQTSAENKALQIQTYNQAKEELAEIIADKKKKDKQAKKKGLPPAVVLDIDETVLDNSPHTAWAIKNNAAYPAGWEEWVNMAKAELIPGAKDFLLAADKMGAEIFYVSNRTVAEKDATMKNLKLHGLPNVDDKHLLLKTTTSQKGPRQAEIAKTNDIVMLIGDNANDLSDIFYKADLKTRFDNVDKIASELGTKYIQLPNPMYGDWEAAIYNYKMDKTDDQKAMDRYNALKPMK